MKMKGQAFRRKTATVQLSDGVELEFVVPPAGTAQRALMIVPPPAPPKQLIKQKGAPPAYLVNEHDPDFKAQEAFASHLQSCIMVWFALKDHKDIEFETTPGPNGPDRAFAEQLAKEIESSGMTQRDVTRIVKAIAQSDGISEEELSAAEGFSA